MFQNQDDRQISLGWKSGFSTSKSRGPGLSAGACASATGPVRIYGQYKAIWIYTFILPILHQITSIGPIQGATKPVSACPGQVSFCAGQAGLPGNLPTGQVKLIPRL